MAFKWLKSRLSDFTIAHLWLAAALVGIFVFLNTHPIRPHDFWWHLAAGREIASTGRIPLFDGYSHLMKGQPYPSYAMFWLADLLLYLIYRLGGPALVVFSNSLLIAAAYGLVARLAYSAAKNLRMVAAVTLTAAALGMDNWNVRPQSFAYLLGAAVLWVALRLRQRPRPLLLVAAPALLALWANLHGSFVIGLVLLGLVCLEAGWKVIRSKQFSFMSITSIGFYPAAALGLAFLGTLLNPRGLMAYEYVFKLSANPVIRQMVPEWAPPQFNSLFGGLLLAVLALNLAAFALSPRCPTAFELLLCLCFGGLALASSRGLVWYGLFSAPLIARHLALAVQEYRNKRAETGQYAGSTWLNWAFLAVLAFASLAALPWFKESIPMPPAKAGLLSAETPLMATAYLLEHELPGPLFNHLAFGSYLIWAASPQVEVFVDTRLELYPVEVWRDYLQISLALDSWEALLERYGINTLMLSPLDQLPLVQAAEGSGRWVRVFEDQAAVIFIRSLLNDHGKGSPK